MGLGHPAGELEGCEACAAARRWVQRGGEARDGGSDEGGEHFSKSCEFEGEAAKGGLQAGQTGG